MNNSISEPSFVDILKNTFKNSFSRAEFDYLLHYILSECETKLVFHHSMAMGMNHMSVGFSKMGKQYATNLSDVNEYLLECLHLHLRDNCLSILI